MKSIYFSILLLTVLGCASEKDMTSKKELSETSSGKQNNRIKAILGEKKTISAPIQISGVAIEGNTMLIDLSYSGGCGEHSFEMIGSLMMAKSLPPIRTVHLIHITTEDKCKKLIMTQIKVDISDLAFKKEKGSEIYLALDGWGEKIKYVFE